MSVLTLSSFIFLVAAGMIVGWRHSVVTADMTHDLHSSSLIAAKYDLKDQVTLEDLPPPDDTYTPEQRRYS